MCAGPLPEGIHACVSLTDEFQQATRAVLSKLGGRSTSAVLCKPIISVLFTIFDENGDGLLDQTEFMDVMIARATRGLDKVKMRSHSVCVYVIERKSVC